MTQLDQAEGNASSSVNETKDGGESDPKALVLRRAVEAPPFVPTAQPVKPMAPTSSLVQGVSDVVRKLDGALRARDSAIEAGMDTAKSKYDLLRIAATGNFNTLLKLVASRLEEKDSELVDLLAETNQAVADATDDFAHTMISIFHEQSTDIYDIAKQSRETMSALTTGAGVDHLTTMSVRRMRNPPPTRTEITGFKAAIYCLQQENQALSREVLSLRKKVQQQATAIASSKKRVPSTVHQVFLPRNPDELVDVRTQEEMFDDIMLEHQLMKGVLWSMVQEDANRQFEFYGHQIGEDVHTEHQLAIEDAPVRDLSKEAVSQTSLGGPATPLAHSAGGPVIAREAENSVSLHVLQDMVRALTDDLEKARERVAQLEGEKKPPAGIAELEQTIEQLRENLRGQWEENARLRETNMELLQTLHEQTMKKQQVQPSNRKFVKGRTGMPVAESQRATAQGGLLEGKAALTDDLARSAVRESKLKSELKEAQETISQLWERIQQLETSNGTWQTVAFAS